MTGRARGVATALTLVALALIGPALGDPTLGIRSYCPLTACTYGTAFALAGPRPVACHLPLRLPDGTGLQPIGGASP